MEDGDVEADAVRAIEDIDERVFFGFVPLQICKFGNTPLQFVYLENYHYNFSPSITMPFSTLLTYIDPLSDT